MPRCSRGRFAVSLSLLGSFCCRNVWFLFPIRGWDREVLGERDSGVLVFLGWSGG